MRFLFLTVLTFLTLSPAYAQDTSILDIPEGQTIINLAVTERVEVEQDLLIATLNFEAKNKDAKALQDDINKVMSKALNESKKHKDIKVATQQYRVYPYDHYPDPQNRTEKTRVREWRGSQGIELKSKNSTDLLELVGTMQSFGMNVTGLNYTVSPELLELTQDSLLEAALEKLQTKAKRVAKALGKSKSDLVNVNVDINHGFQPMPMVRGMAMAKMEMAADMAAPVAESGESTVTLTVNATALLRP